MIILIFLYFIVIRGESVSVPEKSMAVDLTATTADRSSNHGMSKLCSRFVISVWI